MKKVLLSIVLLTVIGFTSCKSEKKENSQEEHSKEMAKVEYHCPMECEGDKTYADKDAKCPVCKMDLVKVEHHDDDDDHEMHKMHDKDSVAE